MLYTYLNINKKIAIENKREMEKKTMIFTWRWDYQYVD